MTSNSIGGGGVNAGASVE